MAAATVLVVVVSGVVYHTCRTAQCDAACTRVEVDAIQVGWRPQSIEGCGWSDVALVCVSASVCGVWCRVEDEVSQRKEKEGSLLSLWGCCVQCNLAKFGRGRCKNSQSVEKFPLGGFGAGRPFLIVGNSLARLRGVCSRKCRSSTSSRGCRSASLQARYGAVRCGTVRYGTAQYGPV